MGKITIDDTVYTFCPPRFKDELNHFAKREALSRGARYTKNDAMEELSSLLFKDASSVNNWTKPSCTYGPTDIEALEIIGNFLQIEYKNLLCPVQNAPLIEAAPLSPNASSEKEFLLFIYKEILSIAEYYATTGGYTIPDFPDIQDPQLISDYHHQLITRLRSAINANALILSDQSYSKLHTLINEIEQDFTANLPVTRWINIYPRYASIKFLYLGEDDENPDTTLTHFYDNEYEKDCWEIVKYTINPQLYDKDSDYEAEYLATEKENRKLEIKTKIEKLSNKEYKHIHYTTKEQELEEHCRKLNELEDMISEAMKNKKNIMSIEDLQELNNLKNELIEIEEKDTFYPLHKSDHKLRFSEIFIWHYTKMMKSIFQTDFPSLMT